jgi:protein involved in polysaccharide export with SLBB domain
LEYRSGRVSVVGAVASPGIYELRHDQMSVIALLMQAGGIVDEGAARIRIARNVPSLDEPTAGYDSDRPARVEDEPYARRAVWSGASWSEGQGRSAMDGVGVARLVFQPQGALITTGWLVVEASGQAWFRQWLDVASGHQRRTLVRAVTERLGPAAPSDVEQRLHVLANLLESRALEGASVSLVDGSGWRRRGNTYEAIAHGPSAEPVGLASDGHPNERRKTLHGARTVALESDSAAVETLVLPIRGLNIPFEDVHLNDGDSVIVERLETQYVSVLGLVTAPGRFPYPPEARFTLAETLAMAGGLDMIADPRYVSVYRPKADGTIASATFQFVNPKSQEELTERLALLLKPGDVVSVEHTPRTRTNVFFDRIFRISLGLYLRPEELWDRR